MEQELNPEIGEQVVELVVKVFNQREDIFDEGFLVMSAIANKFIDVLNKHIDTIAPFIMYGLESKSGAIVRNACGVLSDLCTLVEAPGIVEGFDQYMPILLNLLKDNNTERSVKIIIVSLIGDTFLLTKSKFYPYLEDSLHILESAAELSISLPDGRSESSENLAYQVQLQSALVESYTCFVQNVNDAHDERSYQTLGQFIHNILEFLLNTIDPTFKPDLVSFK